MNYNIHCWGSERLFINKKDFMLKISVKRHVLSVLYSIRQHDTPKNRASKADVLRSRKKLVSGSKSRDK